MRLSTLKGRLAGVDGKAEVEGTVWDQQIRAKALIIRNCVQAAVSGSVRWAHSHLCMKLA